MRRREGNGPNEDDWLAEEDWVEAPTEEMSSPSGRRPRPRPQPPAGMPSRRLLGLVAAVSLVLLVILIAVLQGGDDSTEEPEAPTTPVTTAPGSDAAPTLQIPETGTLSEGDSGARVRRLQRALAQLGFDVSADGAFGPGTTAAVQSFQEDAGLTADGVAGPETARAINAALAEAG
jgi:hypothetical protein